ncbi:MAG TPA: FtsX-like permease family protein, partial [Sediminibacterium sp.]
ISIFLIVGTLIVAKQMRYVKNKQLGYNQDQMMVLRVDNEDMYKNLVLFKKSLQARPEVQSVSLMSGEPGGFFDGYVFEVEDHTDKWNARTEFADFEFVQTLGLQVVAGRDFSAQFPTDSTNSVLINQTAAAKLGWTPEQAIGKWLRNTVRDDAKRRIIGVVADFNYRSLKENVEPLVIAPNIDRRVILVKLRGGDLQTGIAAVDQEYKRIAPAYPFEYKFLDDQFDNLYRKDVRQQTILSIFAVLAILVACLGLFGLASFSATKRFKEIGIRKILGSSVGEIVLLLSKDLLRPVVVACCIALPAGYWIMHRWLENFAYRTSLSWWVFCLAAVIVFAIAVVTVGVKAVKAAMANPVKSLRTE